MRDFEVPPVLPEGASIDDNSALPVLNMGDFEREEAAFRLDEIAKARFITLTDGRCPRCEARIEAEELNPDGVANARIRHIEPCIAGEAGMTEADELMRRFKFTLGYVFATMQRDDRRVMYVSWARVETDEQQGEEFR